MRSFSRNLAAWSVTLALLTGLWLPLSAQADVYDADGICDPLVPQGQATQRLDDAIAGSSAGHCLFCHLRHDMAGAFVSSVLQIVSSAEAVAAVAIARIDRHSLDAAGDTPPRGPPARS